MKSVEAKHNSFTAYTSVYGKCWENRFADILLSPTFVLSKLLNYEFELLFLLCCLNFVLFNRSCMWKLLLRSWIKLRKATLPSTWNIRCFTVIYFLPMTIRLTPLD